MNDTPAPPIDLTILQRHRLACRLILWTLAIQVVGLCAILSIGLLTGDRPADWAPVPALIVLIATLATSCASLCGWWVLSAKSSAASAEPRNGFTRLWVRYSVLSVVVFAIAEESFQRLAPPPNENDVVAYIFISLAFRLLYLASINSLLLAGATLLARVSERVDAPRERKRFRRARLWLILSIPASLMIFSGRVTVFFFPNATGAEAIMFLGLFLLFVAGLAALIYGLRGLTHLNRRLRTLAKAQPATA